MSAVLKPKTTKTLGGITDQLHNLREDKRKLEAQIKVIEASYTELETEAMALMDAQGVEKTTGKLATISINESIVANLKDWDAFTKYIKKTGYFHLLQRRVSDVAARELFETKGAVPGLEPFTKRKLNLTTVK